MREVEPTTGEKNGLATTPQSTNVPARGEENEAGDSNAAGQMRPRETADLETGDYSREEDWAKMTEIVSQGFSRFRGGSGQPRS